MTGKLFESILEMQEEKALVAAKEMLEKGHSGTEILAEARKALAEVGNRYDQGKYFLPELLIAAEVMKAILEVVKPALRIGEVENKKGKIVIGSVEGDIHDIGKGIVVFMLEAYGFEVIDLGVDVKANTFLDEVKKNEADVLALSGLLTAVFETMKEVVDVFKEAGLRDKTKVMVGGCFMDDNVLKHIGADAYGKDALEAVNLASTWLTR